MTYYELSVITNTGFPYYNLVDGRYKSKIGTENIEKYYEYDKRTVAFYIIEHLAEHIIEGTNLKEETLW